MRNDTVKMTIFVVSLILTVAWMCIIFGFSANNAEESTVQSNTVTEMLIKLFNPDFENMDECEQQKMIEAYDGIVRKLAHFTAYAVLGFLLCLCIYNAPVLVVKPYLWSMAACTAFAATDEYHQTFVDGRAGRFTDILIDSTGAMCGVVVLIAVIKNKTGKKRGV